MRKIVNHSLTMCIALLIINSLTTICYADNPIAQTIFTADPAPMVFDGTLYLYTGHDEDIAPESKFIMHDYQCFSTTDMVNWTHHGAILDIRKVFAWSGGDANAAQCIYHNGKKSASVIGESLFSGGGGRRGGTANGSPYALDDTGKGNYLQVSGQSPKVFSDDVPRWKTQYSFSCVEKWMGRRRRGADWGGFEVAMKWKDGKLQSASLKNSVPASVKLIYGTKSNEVSIKAGQTLNLNADLEVVN